MTEPAELLRVVLAGTHPAEVLQVAAATLTALLDAQVQCWLSDYEETVLTACGGPAIEAADPEVLRVYAAQVPSQRRRPDGLRTYWPLTVRGARWGVLELTQGPDAPDLVLGSPIERAVQVVADALSQVMPLSDDYQMVRRVRPLTVAAEMQWALLPAATSYAEAGVQVAGGLEPAYSVSGDCFDFNRSREHLDVAVFDGSGRGVAASLATAVTVSAYRNARRSGLSLGEQASLADQALYAQYNGLHFVAATLLRLDVSTGRLAVVDAGSPIVLQLRDREVSQVAFEAQLPLGMFEETVYVEQYVQLRPDDRIVIVGDGVHDARSTSDEPFGAQQLLAAVRGTGLLNAAEAARHIIRSLHVHTAGAPLAGDAVVVCLDWTPDKEGAPHA